jgi:hypothetical protein
LAGSVPVAGRAEGSDPARRRAAARFFPRLITAVQRHFSQFMRSPRRDPAIAESTRNRLAFWTACFSSGINAEHP